MSRYLVYFTDLLQALGKTEANISYVPQGDAFAAQVTLRPPIWWPHWQDNNEAVYHTKISKERKAEIHRILVQGLLGSFPKAFPFASLRVLSDLFERLDATQLNWETRKKVGCISRTIADCGLIWRCREVGGWRPSVYSSLDARMICALLKAVYGQIPPNKSAAPTSASHLLYILLWKLWGDKEWPRDLESPSHKITTLDGGANLRPRVMVEEGIAHTSGSEEDTVANQWRAAITFRVPTYMRRVEQNEHPVALTTEHLDLTQLDITGPHKLRIYARMIHEFSPIVELDAANYLCRNVHELHPNPHSPRIIAKNPNQETGKFSESTVGCVEIRVETLFASKRKAQSMMIAYEGAAIVIFNILFSNAGYSNVVFRGLPPWKPWTRHVVAPGSVSGVKILAAPGSPAFYNSSTSNLSDDAPMTGDDCERMKRAFANNPALARTMLKKFRDGWAPNCTLFQKYGDVWRYTSSLAIGAWDTRARYLSLPKAQHSVRQPCDTEFEMVLLATILNKFKDLVGSVQVDDIHVLDIPALTEDVGSEEEKMSALAIAHIHLVGLLNARIEVVLSVLSKEDVPAAERWTEFNTMVEGFASARTWRRQRSNNVELIFDQIGVKQTWRAAIASRELKEQWCWIVEAALMCQYPTMLLHRKESKKIQAELQSLINIPAAPKEEEQDSDSLFPLIVKSLTTGRAETSSECFRNACVALRLILTHVVTDAVWMPLYNRALRLSENKKEPGEADDHTTWSNLQIWRRETPPNWKPSPRAF